LNARRTASTPEKRAPLPVAGRSPTNPPDNATRGRAYALKALASEAAELAQTATNRNHRCNVAALKLGKYVGTGWLDRGEVEAALHDAMATNSSLGNHPHGDDEVRATVASGLSAGIAEGTAHPPELPDRPAPGKPTKHRARPTPASSDEGNASRERKPPSGAAESLIGLADGCELFHDATRQAFVTFSDNGTRKNAPVDGCEFRDWLQHRYYRAYEAAAKPDQLDAAISTLTARAKYDGKECATFQRVAPLGGGIVIDMGDPLWRAVVVTKDGWTVVDVAPVKFIRSGNTGAFAEPDSNGTLAELADHVNLDPHNLRLAAVWILAAYMTNGPYPGALVLGNHGSGKSSVCDVLRDLTDPHASDTARESRPRSIEDAWLMTTMTRVILLDNLSGMTDELSDCLCTISTGGSFTRRKLYSNGDTSSIKAKATWILNSIEDIATRSDLLSRAILLDVKPFAPGAQRPEREVKAAYSAARGRLFGGILNALASCLSNLDRVKLPLNTRMSDALGWAMAGEGATGLDGFYDAFMTMQTDASNLALELCPIYEPLLELVRRGDWEGTSVQLLTELGTLAGEGTRRPDWPRTPKRLHGLIKRIAPNLNREGIYYGQIEKTPRRIYALRRCDVPK
jgi:hypothetical protein